MESSTTFCFAVVMLAACLAVVRIGASDTSSLDHLLNEIHHSLKALSTDYVDPTFQEFKDDKSAHGALKECQFYCDAAIFDAQLASESFEVKSRRNETLVFLAVCGDYLERCQTYLMNNRDEVNQKAGDKFDDILGYISGPLDKIERAFDIVCNMTRT